MAATKAAFAELIGQDVRVELPRLRKLSFYGIPHDVRGEVWKRLLLALPSQSAASSGGLEASNGYAREKSLPLEEAFNATEKEERGHSDWHLYGVIESEMKRYRKNVDYFSHSKTIERMHVLLARHALRRETIDDRRDTQMLIHLLAPLVFVLRKQSVAAACFKSFMKSLEGRFMLQNRKRLLANMMLVSSGPSYTL